MSPSYRPAREVADAAEAIQICQLSLWIKTGARGKQLTSLDHTIREGNSTKRLLAVFVMPKGRPRLAATDSGLAHRPTAPVVGISPAGLGFPRPAAAPGTLGVQKIGQMRLPLCSVCAKRNANRELVAAKTNP